MNPISGPALISFIPNRNETNVAIGTYTSASRSVDQDFTADGALLEGSRDAFRDAVVRALSGGSTYPEYPDADAAALLAAMRWEDGLPKIVSAPPSYIRFTLQEQTFALLPEMLPIGGGRWLDQLAPSFRTFRGGSAGRILRRDRSVAILFQEGDRRFDFPHWSDHVARSLRRHGLIVDEFPGLAVPANAGRRHGLLSEIFYKHAAVIFFGHLADDGSGQYGWMLSPGDVLPMRFLAEFLQRVALPAGQRIPADVVFAGCCASAWRDPHLRGWPGVLYPKLFLDGGVRHFVGAWMDIVGSSPESVRDVVTAMAEGFLRRWAQDPAGAVYHLYDTKSDIGFSLATSLFHIYGPQDIEDRRVASETEAPEVRALEVVKPLGPITSEVSTTDRLGDYALGARLWSDQLSKTFWATSPAGNHLVQVLSDSWQGDAVLAVELAGALAKLSGADPGDRHLVPNRVEACAWHGAHDSPAPKHGPLLLALVCDRPSSERPEDWRTLRQRTFDGSAPSHLKDLMRDGADIAEALQALHSKRLRHGNLSPESVLFVRAGAEDRVVLKDAWLSMLGQRRRAGGVYAAPDEMAAADEPKADCWSLGAMLFEMASGAPPFPDVVAGDVQRPPSLNLRGDDYSRGLADALDRILQECLLPTARLRPSAAQLAFRLRIAEYYEAYTSEFEADLYRHIAAGQRLFHIVIDDPHELDETLAHLEAPPRSSTVFAFHPGRGVVRHATDEVLIPWIGAAELSAALRREADPGVALPRITENFVLALNGDRLMSAALADLSIYEESAGVPVLVVFGGVPWHTAAPVNQIKMERTLQRCQMEIGSPVVVFVTDSLFLDDELDRLCHQLPFPWLAPAELFNRILSAPKTEGLNVPELSLDQAADLAKQLDPISGRELTYALRLCALQYGRIDERVSEMRDLERANLLRERGDISYFPLGKLPEPAAIGLPPDARRSVERWADRARAGDWDEPSTRMPTRIFIDGPAGSGKTLFALVIGSLARRPVVRIEPARAMGKNVGDSESNLRRMLRTVTLLSGAIVLLDDIDRFLNAASDSELSVLSRMESRLLHWVDDVSRKVIIVMTAKSPDALPAQWRRRVELRLPLAEPHGLSDGAHSDPYRADVFRAVFHQRGLSAVSKDHQLAQDLAEATNPTAAQPRALHSPSALRAPDSALGDQRMRLAAACDVEWWVRETLLLHGDRGNPDTPGFWLDKLR